jgi:hypothetical protein
MRLPVSAAYLIRLSRNGIAVSRPSQTNPLNDPDAGSYALQDLDDFNVDPDSDSDSDDDDDDVDLPDAFLPTLSTLESSLNVEQVRSRLGDNPSASSLTSEVKRTLPLNTKQSMIVERVLSEFLASKDDPYNPAKHKQFLLHVGGEAGVGKSRVSDAIVTGIGLINRRDEAILLAPTGAAADNIGGATYHAALGISLRRTLMSLPGSNDYGPIKPFLYSMRSA